MSRRRDQGKATHLLHGLRLRHRQPHWAQQGPSACTSSSRPTMKGAVSTDSSPSRSTRATPAICMGESFRPHWMRLWAGSLTHRDVWAMTGHPEIKFRKLVPLDQEVAIVGQLTRSHSRAYEAQGEIRLPDGTALVEGNGMYVRIPDEMVEQAKSALDFGEVVPAR